MKTDLEKWFAKEGEFYLKKNGVRSGQFVLDFGCNVGHYTIPIAKVVGKQGKVYAVDKDEQALDQLMQEATAKGIKNIIPIITSGEFKIKLESNHVDVVLLYDVLHYLSSEERRELYREVYRILKIGGLLSIYPKHYKLDEPLWELSDMELESLIKELENANFCFRGKDFKKLLHNDNYERGYILKFTLLSKPYGDKHQPLGNKSDGCLRIKRSISGEDKYKISFMDF